MLTHVRKPVASHTSVRKARWHSCSSSRTQDCRHPNLWSNSTQTSTTRYSAGSVSVQGILWPTTNSLMTLYLNCPIVWKCRISRRHWLRHGNRTWGISILSILTPPVTRVPCVTPPMQSCRGNVQKWCILWCVRQAESSAFTVWGRNTLMCPVTTWLIWSNAVTPSRGLARLSVACWICQGRYSQNQEDSTGRILMWGFSLTSNSQT